MAIAQQQTPVAHIGATTNADSIVYGSAVPAGALLLAGFLVGTSDGQKTLTVSDTVNGAWTRIAFRFAAGIGLMELWGFVNSAAGTPTVNVSYGGVAVTVRWSIHAYTGLATSNVVDQTNAALSGGVETLTHGYDITTTVANSLIFAICESASTTETFTAETNYTIVAVDAAGPSSRYVAQHQIVSATGTYSGAFTLSIAENWQAVIANFKELSAGDPVLLAWMPTTHVVGGPARDKMIPSGMTP